LTFSVDFDIIYLIEFLIQRTGITYMTELTNKDHEDIMELDKRMSTHEVMCEERWRTCFSRLDDIGSDISRLETIAIGACGTIIVGSVSVILSIFLMSS
jgi:hypothetical protein